MRAIILCLTLAACGTEPSTATGHRAEFVRACQREGSNVLDCTNAAFQLYPDGKPAS